jgi:hypothetical protein
MKNFSAKRYGSLARALAAFAVAGTAPVFAQSSGAWSPAFRPGVVRRTCIRSRPTSAAMVPTRKFPRPSDIQSYSTAQRRRSPSLQALGVLAFRWEWIVGAGAILLFITLASAFVSYEPICRPYCSMNRTSWQLQSKQDEHPLDLKLASNQNPSPTRAMRVEVEPFS